MRARRGAKHLLNTHFAEEDQAVSDKRHHAQWLQTCTRVRELKRDRGREVVLSGLLPFSSMESVLCLHVSPPYMPHRLLFVKVYLPAEKTLGLPYLFILWTRCSTRIWRMFQAFSCVKILWKGSNPEVLAVEAAQRPNGLILYQKKWYKTASH